MTNHEKELLELGRRMQEFFDQGYVSRKQSFAFGFVKGVATGAGAFVGGTLVISLLLWVLSLLDTVPFAGNIIDNIKDSLRSSN